MRHATVVLAALIVAFAAAPLSSAADLDEVRKRGELRGLAMADDPKDEFFTDRLVVKYFGEEAPEILKRAREEAER